MADRDQDPGDDSDEPVHCRLLDEEEWHLARHARLAALRDAPEFFLPTEPHESVWTDDDWRAACVVGRWAVAQARAGVVGLARLTDEGNGPHVGSVWTHPRHRRRGIASALVRLLVEEERDRDVFVWVIHPNPAAFQLYESLGFKPTFERQVLASIGREEERLRLSGDPRRW
jgi:ribosomal protein S18 acetylase RimI-like enzyme